MIDIVATLDAKYSGAGAVQCPNEGKPAKSQNGSSYSGHGAMQVHKSAAFLVCGRCGYQTPVARP